MLERRYVPFGILSARVTMVDAKTDPAGRQTQPAGNCSKSSSLWSRKISKDIAVQETAKGTMIYLVSDDNYNPFQQTLLLQFLLANPNH